MKTVKQIVSDAAHAASIAHTAGEVMKAALLTARPQIKDGPDGEVVRRLIDDALERWDYANRYD